MTGTNEQSVVITEAASLRIPMLSVIGAGKSMADLPIQGWRSIRMSPKVRRNDRLCGAIVQGDSLIGDGINDGDIAIFRLNFDIDEVTPGRLAAVWTPNGLLVKHVYLTLDEQIRLVSSNPQYDDLVFDSCDVEIQGIVIRVERDM